MVSDLPGSRTRRSIWLARVVLAACLAVVALSTYHTMSEVEALGRQEFVFACQEIRDRILDRLDDYGRLLKGGAALFDTFDAITREDWHTFVSRQDVERQYQGIQGIGFAEVVPAEDLTRHIQKIRREGFPYYRIWPGWEREAYTSIVYVEPFSGRNLRVLGYDMFSSPVRRAAMERARDLACAVLSGRVLLVRETGEDTQFGALHYLPVYHRGMPVDTVEQRRAALRGWVFIPYRMNNFMHGVLGGWDSYEGKSIRLVVYDGESLSPDAFLYDSKAAGGEVSALPSRFSTQIPIDMEGRRWTLYFSRAGVGPSSAEYGKVWIVFTTGTAISLLVFILIASLLNTRHIARVMAGRLMVELRESEAFAHDVLDSLHEHVCVLDSEGVIVAVNESWVRFARENGTVDGRPGPVSSVGTRYLDCCDMNEAAVDAEKVRAAVEGITSVLKGERRHFSMEYPCHSPEEQRWFHMTVCSLQGPRPGLVISHSNITDRKRAQESAAALAVRYQTILQNAADGIHILDEEGNVVEANNTFCDMLGYSHEEVLELNVADWDSQWVREELREKNREFRSGHGVLETTHRRKDGGVLTVEVSLVGVTLEGRSYLYASSRDISERKRAEAALREAHRRLDDIVEFFPDATFALDTNGKVTHWNRAIEKLTGVMKADMLGKGDYEYAVAFHGERRPVLIDYALAPGGDRGFNVDKYDFVRRDGGLVVGEGFVPGAFRGRGAYLSSTASVLRDSAGKVTGAIQSIRDITERKRIEEALRESEGLYRSMFEKNRAVKLLIEPGTGLIVDANPAACDYYGYPRDRLQSMRIMDINVLPSEKLREEMELAKTKSRGFFTFRHRLASGDLRDVEVHSGPIEIRGHTLLYSIVHDITERKRAETALRESKQAYDDLVAQVPVGIYKIRMTAGGEIRFDYVSPRWCEIMSLRSEDALGDATALFDLIHRDDVQSMMNANRVAKESLDQFQWEGRFLVNGRWRVMHIESLPERLENGDIVWTGSQQDITDQRLAEEQRQGLEYRLQQARKAESLGRMAGAIAHHFNNMLGIVIGNLELATAELPPRSEPRKCIANAIKASGRAAEISRFMLTYLGQTTGRKEPLDLADAIAESEALLLVSVPANVQLTSRLPERGLVVHADGAYIKQILTNLISNAVEAIGDAEGRVTVSAEAADAGEVHRSRCFPADWQPGKGRYACLTVSDTGFGLDSGTIERIFDPFFTTKFTGRGMGLPVVLGMVRAHEGAVSVESQTGRGATFRVYLPLLEKEELPAEPKETAVDVGESAGGLVLLVDDETMLRVLAGSMLKTLGYDVVQARDGAEAVAIFRARGDEFALVLLDCSMPGKSGWETLTALRALRPDIPVILSSGYDEAQVSRGEHTERPQAFLSKPYGMEALKRAIVACMESEGVGEG